MAAVRQVASRGRDIHLAAIVSRASCRAGPEIRTDSSAGCSLSSCTIAHGRRRGGNQIKVASRTCCTCCAARPRRWVGPSEMLLLPHLRGQRNHAKTVGHLLFIRSLLRANGARNFAASRPSERQAPNFKCPPAPSGARRRLRNRPASWRAGPSQPIWDRAV